MTLSTLGYHNQITYSSKELLEISEEIRNQYAPVHYPLTPMTKVRLPTTSTTSFSNNLSTRKLKQDEILSISTTISASFKPTLTNKQSSLTLLPLDPFHAYAYWQLTSSITQRIDKNKPLILRIYWQENEQLSLDETKFWFDIEINPLLSMHKIQLPIDGTGYAARLGQQLTPSLFTSFIEAKRIAVPHDKTKPIIVQHTATRKPYTPTVNNPSLPQAIILDSPDTPHIPDFTLALNQDSDDKKTFFHHPAPTQNFFEHLTIKLKKHHTMPTFIPTSTTLDTKQLGYIKTKTESGQGR